MATIAEGFRGETSTICVVLGGRGFIGRSLVLRLLNTERWIVRIADSAPSLQLDPKESDSILSEAISTGRASYFQVDVREKSQIVRAIEGSSVVFHLDGPNSSLRDIYLLHTQTVQGTKNVINACRECKVKRLVYNSSADVVFDGIHSIYSGDESLSYPWRFEDILTDFKAQAEALILFANGIDGLLTCSLRPSNVFGPGDTCFVPFLATEAKSGRAKFIVGSGENMCDFTYVENVAHAHICAAEAFQSGMAFVAGKAFFITNFEPMKFWEFISLILEGLGYQRPMIQISTRIAWFILVVLKWIHEKRGFGKHGNLLSTPSTIHLLSSTRTFNCSAAQEHIAYTPIVSLKDGITLTVESFSHLAKDSHSTIYRDFSGPSKADKLLGGGKVADILLWRDEKTTFKCFLFMVLLFYWFVISGRTFISSSAKLLLVISIILSGHCLLPSTLFGFTIQKISSSYFEVSETVIKDSISNIASTWNRGVNMLRLLAKGEDWNFFSRATFLQSGGESCDITGNDGIGVAIAAYFLKLLLSISFAMVVGAGLIFAFTAFFVYEQYEEELDRVAEASYIGLRKPTVVLMQKLPESVASFLCDSNLLRQGDEPAGVKGWRQQG